MVLSGDSLISMFFFLFLTVCGHHSLSESRPGDVVLDDGELTRLFPTFGYVFDVNFVHFRMLSKSLWVFLTAKFGTQSQVKQAN